MKISFKAIFFICFLIDSAVFIFTCHYCIGPKFKPPVPSFGETIKISPQSFAIIKTKASPLKKYIKANDYDRKICFLIDMKIASGKNRFFVYDIQKDSILASGLVAHGSCDNGFKLKPNFQIQLTAAVAALEDSGLETATKEDLAWPINYTEWIHQIVTLTKEILYCIPINVCLSRKYSPCLFVIAGDALWFRRCFCKN